MAALWPAQCAAAAATGALAAALADTLGTEIGTLARSQPRLLPTFRAVAAGTPGAVSWPGTVATLVGGALVGAAAAAANLLPWQALPIVVAAGAGGAMFESLLGGSLAWFAETPGTIRNLLTTAVGATVAGLAAAGGLLS